MAGEVVPRRVDFDEAVELANWLGINIDLAFVCATCDRLLVTDKEDLVLVRALTTAAFVAYARCFKGNEGVRVGLDETDLAGMGDVLGLHRYVVDMRDKHIAHSVSPFEQVVIGVAELEDQKTAVTHLAVQWGGLLSQNIREFKKMATFLIKAVATRIDDAHAKVHTKFRTLTPEQVLALPPAEFKAPDPSEVAQARDGLKRRRLRRGNQPPTST